MPCRERAVNIVKPLASNLENIFCILSFFIFYETLVYASTSATLAKKNEKKKN